MNLKKAMIYVDAGDKEQREEVEKSVSNVLTAYPSSILAEVGDDQIDFLRRQGIEVEPQEDAQMIKLRAIEFDTSREVPSPPPMLRFSAADIEKGEKDYWIVQFIGPMKAEWSETIRSLGGELEDYIPENAFLVYMTSQTMDEVEKLSFVNWVGPYQPAYKVSPLMRGTKSKASPREFGMLSFDAEAFKPAPLGNIKVILHESADPDQVSQQIEQLGGKAIITGKNAIRASLDPSAAYEVARNSKVKWIEPYAVPRLFNDVAAQITGVKQVWDNHGLDGEGQIVAVADTGLDIGVDDDSIHEDFKGQIVNIHSWPIPAEWREYLDNETLDDGAADLDSGHGTHVAGSVLGNGAKSGGSIRGMAFKSNLVFQAVEQWINWKLWIQQMYRFQDGFGLVGIPDDLRYLFQQAYDDGARIHTNSWGGTHDPDDRPIYGQYTDQSWYIDEFIWNHKDMVILFAASNDGRDGDHCGVIDLDSLSVQACSKNCISVGACENNRTTGGYAEYGYGHLWGDAFPCNPIKDDLTSDNPEGMVAFSSRGPTDDGRIKPDVVAPGTNVLSVRSSQAKGKGWGLDPNNPHYMYMGGTSMSTPLVAGTVALIRQYLQKFRNHENPSAALIKAVLINGATPLRGQYGTPEVGPIPDPNQGWGRVNLGNSLFPEDPIKIVFRDDPEDTLGSGELREFGFEVVNDTAPFKATLAWTDYPSGPESGGLLVNTLRLSVISPGGETLQGGPTNNNVQQVVIENPQTGIYKVRVRGIRIPTESWNFQRQDFALVVSGSLD